MTTTVADFKKAIQRLSEVLDLKETDVVRDSAIKRFEICFDLAWKSIKSFAKKQGVECYSPRECFKSAFQLKVIDYEDEWLKMLDDRNTTAHIYAQVYAEQIYGRLKRYLELFEALTDRLPQEEWKTRRLLVSNLKSSGCLKSSLV